MKQTTIQPGDIVTMKDGTAGECKRVENGNIVVFCGWKVPGGRILKTLPLSAVKKRAT